jgi:hypothetical protein
LEQIISYLPSVDIVIISSVNKMSYNCVSNSSLAHSKLFLRPSKREQEIWWYCERLDAGPDAPILDPSFEPSMEGNMLSKLAFPVTLCPLLRLVDIVGTTTIGRLRRQGWQEQETTKLVGVPAENTKYADMFLIDPPTSRVAVELTYKHTLRPSLLLRAKCAVPGDRTRGLTFNDMVKSVCTQRGVVFVHQPATALNNYKACHYPKNGRTIIEDMVQQVREHGGSFVLDTEKSFVVFPHRIVVPSAEEWLEMDGKRAREKE